MIGLSWLHCLSLSENDLSTRQDDVLAANRSRLSTANLFNATLTLREANVHIALSVFQGVNDALLFWCDSCALHIFSNYYPKQISAVHFTATSALYSRSGSQRSF